MTAGRSAGTEQGQGRTGRIPCVAPDIHPLGCSCCVWMGATCIREGHGRHGPSVPPARDSGRDEARERDTQLDTSVSFGEAREAVARWLADTYEPALDWPDLDSDQRRVYRIEADQLLVLPELSALLRDGTTT